ncbi:hypothetical protein BAU15_12560 [Enterococcus sp. JM4C]|uniref:AAA family ATPase n=1 Tax=Candidatus Enterococcus huntleyi TaxID=1857217 RepID=UPI00137B6F71|nr:SMC family ATPase [Enterococcus sp. JM4C]KAF1296384.1 hypothetical protein BAU15_12560 [Enterococcus sp. JM4C]
MQPRKLTLKNFGPFIDESLDFSKLSDSSLFLISGKTGSGKTTLFDGMTYALFGETSGRLRLGKEMRSSFAPPSEETAVSFLFEHQDLLYLVERRPEQILTKKKGEGVRTQTAKVSLTIMEASGKELRQYTKRTEVDQTIKELLHLDAKQFSQIVLLPQGEFRNFLVANSNEKEAVLRNLFGTQLYQTINEWLKSRLKKQQEQLDHLFIETDHLRQQFIWQGEPVEAVSTQELMTNWATDLALQEDEVKLVNTQFEALQKQQESAERTYYQSKELMDAFEQLAVVQEQQLKNQAKQPEVAELKQREQALRWAEKQQGLVEKQETARKQLVKITSQKEQVLKTQSECVQAFSIWEEQKEAAVAWAERLKNAQERVQKVQFLLPIAKEYEALLTSQKEQEKALEELTTQSQQLEEAKQTNEKERDQLALISKERESWQEEKLSLYETDQLFTTFQQAEDSHKEERAKYDVLVEKNAQGAQQLELFTAQVQEKTQELATVKSQWAKMQIARLSLLLVPGEPCPVCGATEHPTGTAEHQTYSAEMINENEEELALAEENLLQAQQRVQQQEAQQQQNSLLIQASQAQQEQLLKQVEACEQKLCEQIQASYALTPELLTAFADQSYADILTQLTTMHQEQGLKIHQAEQQMLEIDETLERVKSEQIVVEQSLAEKKNKLGELSGQMQSIAKQMGQESLPQLEEEQARLTAEMEQLAAQIATHDKEGIQLREDLLRIKEQVHSLEEQQAEQKKAVATNQQVLEEVIADTSFVETLEDVNGLLAEVGQLESMQQMIQEYEQEVVVLKSRCQTLKDKIGEQERPDLTAIQLIWEEKKQQMLACKEEVVQKSEQVQRNQSYLKQLTDLYQKSQAQLDEISSFQQLSQTLNGENTFKISLERYVLQAYLEEVLVVANQRLGRLTKNRYQFELSDGVGSYRSKTGLEINVYDDNAGTTRSAHTLSGGESFIAALALALSLAEVIQSQAGGITIEALFIDEGFGSLDEESLEMAMEALETIENEGRMIGIISHVRELKERILQQVLVKSTGTGQSTIDYQLAE